MILECGPTLPDVYIWGFTVPGTENIRAVVYNFGQGPRLQSLARSLGDLNVISNTASLFIDKLPLAAHGLYTCQALYDTPQGAKLIYYYVQLAVLGEGNLHYLFCVTKYLFFLISYFYGLNPKMTRYVWLGVSAPSALIQAGTDKTSMQGHIRWIKVEMCFVDITGQMCTK